MATAGQLIEIKYNEDKLRRIERLVRGIPGAMGRMVPRAINRTATTARANAARNIADQIKLPVSTIKKSIKILKAKRNCWLGSLLVSSRRLPLIVFGARELKKKGVSYKISKTSPRKRLPSAFILTMPKRGEKQKKGHRGVFMRKRKAAESAGRRKGRLPIRELFGPSLGMIFNEAGMVANKTMFQAGKDLDKNLYSQLDLILSRASARGAA